MKKKPKICRVLLAILAIFLAFTFLQILLNPIRWPRMATRQYILWHTPMGTNIHDVVEFARSRDDWRVHYVSFERGFLPPGRSSIDSLVGEQSIRVNWGSYGAWYKPLHGTHVSVLWGFDSDGNLTDVLVHKTMGG